MPELTVIPRPQKGPSPKLYLLADRELNPLGLYDSLRLATAAAVYLSLPWGSWLVLSGGRTVYDSAAGVPEVAHKLAA